MKYKSFFVLLSFSIVSSFHFNHHEIISFPESIKDLVENKFVYEIQKENYNDIKIQRNLINDSTSITYSSSQFGYKYNGSYDIFETNLIDNYKIIYKNNFLNNTIQIERIDPEKIKISVEIDTKFPIPKSVLKTIISNKIKMLK